MKKLNPKNNNPILKIKTGTAEEFMATVKRTMRAADKKEMIPESHTLTFEDPLDMLAFLSVTKIKLINNIRKHPDSITNIAKSLHRNRAAVYRDIHELEKFGLVKIHEEINPGHGRHKIVELIAPALKLEAYLF
jgi:predicted transcriptional regulator